MKSILLLGLLVGWVGVAGAAEPSPEEVRVAEAVKAPGVTVVHFWAPWCATCAAELAKNAWGTFIDTNAETRFIFVTAKSAEDGREVLAKHGVGGQPNFELVKHPNPSRTAGTEMTAFLGLPMTWLPATWVFKNGRLLYALNNGEVRFPILQQFLRDAAAGG